MKKSLAITNELAMQDFTRLAKENGWHERKAIEWYNEYIGVCDENWKKIRFWEVLDDYMMYVNCVGKVLRRFKDGNFEYRHN